MKTAENILLKAFEGRESDLSDFDKDVILKAMEEYAAQFRSIPTSGTRHIQQLELRIDSLQDQLKSGIDAYQKLKDDNRNLRSVMIAAAEEIKSHWNAHCDKDGYGPSNLLHRLEQGIPAKYNYTSGAFAKREQEIERLKEENKKIAFQLWFIEKHIDVTPSDYEDKISRIKELEAQLEVYKDACKTVVCGYEGNGMEQMDIRDDIFYTHCKRALESSPEQPEQKRLGWYPDPLEFNSEDEWFEACRKKREQQDKPQPKPEAQKEEQSELLKYCNQILETKAFHEGLTEDWHAGFVTACRKMRDFITRKNS